MALRLRRGESRDGLFEQGLTCEHSNKRSDASPNGPWSFGGLMTALAPSDPAGISTKISPLPSGVTRPMVGLRAKLTAYMLPFRSQAGPSISRVKLCGSVSGVAVAAACGVVVNDRDRLAYQTLQAEPVGEL